MSRISAKSLDLVADGKIINIKTPEKKNFELNKALLNDAEFAKFASNPKEFAKKYKLNIDKSVSDQLASKLNGINRIDDLARISRDDGGEATVWAVAVGAYSMASTKIAVAF